MSSEQNLNDPLLRASAVKAARGLRPFDMLVRNTQMMNMITGRMYPADIGLVGPLIASVHAPDSQREAQLQLCADGAFALPGFIDTHMHVESSMVTPAEYTRAVLPRGVTTALWDPHELANVHGTQGVDYACLSATASPMRFLTLAPTCVPSAPGYESGGADFGSEQIAALLAREDIHGAAELMTMQPLLTGDSRVQDIVAASLASGKRLCGHGRGLTDADLAAYVAAGVETDHELISADDLLAKLEAGLTIELRGSHDHLLPEFAAALNTLGHLPQTVTLCTDDVFPDDLCNKGGLDQVIRRLIACGMPEVWAYQAATSNAANRIGRPDLGLIAPGKRADIVFVTNLTDVSTSHVIADGQLVASEGKLLQPIQDVPTPRQFLRSVSTDVFKASDFDVTAKAPKARVATLSKPRFPVWGERELDVQDDNIVLPADMIRMAVCHRHGNYSHTRVALLEQWGTWRGAFATTVSHDSHNLTVFGRNPEDMALAANTLRVSQGGLAVVADCKVMAHLALPICGLISSNPLQQVAQEFANVRAELDKLVDWEPPYLVFKALFGASLVCNAGPRLSDVGLVDVFNKHLLESCVLTGTETYQNIQS